MNGAAVDCPPRACPGDLVTFTGTARQASYNIYNIWRLPNGTCPRNNVPDTAALPQTANKCKHASNTCGPFYATNLDPGDDLHVPCLRSNLTVNVTTIMMKTLIVIIFETDHEPINSTIIAQGNVYST